MGRIQSVPTADTFKKATCFPWMIGSDVAGDRTAYLWWDDNRLYRPREHGHTYHEPRRRYSPFGSQTN